MILRRWHGWASAETADAYERLLHSKILPRIDAVSGYRGAWVLKTPRGAEVEFVTLTLFDSMEAVRAFAGNHFEMAVVPPEAWPLLTRFDSSSSHYTVVSAPSAA